MTPPRTLAFNGVDTIAAKTRAALADYNIAGVMIWEVGQDCRVHEVQHADRPNELHVASCPGGEQSSLLAAVHTAVEQSQQPAADQRKILSRDEL